jgi:hypothetical protein
LIDTTSSESSLKAIFRTRKISIIYGYSIEAIEAREGVDQLGQRLLTARKKYGELSRDEIFSLL